MDTNNKQVNLIEHIKNELQDLEFDYRPGAWEGFQKHQANHHPPLTWRGIIGKAALVLAILGVLMLIALPVKDDKQLTSRVKVKEQNYKHSAAVNRARGPIYQKKNKRSPGSSKITLTVADARRQFVSQDSLSSTSLKISSALYIDAKNTSDFYAAKVAFVFKEQKSIHSEMSFADFLEAEKEKNLDKEPENLTPSGRWGIELAIGQARDSRQKGDWNLGTSLTYALDQKFSLSSGIYYNELGGKKDIIQGGMATAGTGKKLQRVEAGMRGLELPLELRYKISANFYTSVGLSAYAITRQQESMTYTAQKVIMSTFVDQNGDSHMQTNVIHETSRETSVPERRYLGLYNVSLGYLQQLSPGHALLLEPYLKIPIKEFSKEELDLSQIGLRLKFSF
jgi:hypothetical protein